MDSFEAEVFTNDIAPSYNLIEIESKDGFLGRGSYGLVWIGAGPNGKCAVKQNYIKEQDPEWYYRHILREQLRHPNIIGLESAIVPAHRQFIYTIYTTVLPDNLLDAILDRNNNPLSDQDIRGLMIELLRGVNFLHSARVMHRDLKPNNILLRNYPRGLKICDFGFARGYEEDLTTSRANQLTKTVANQYYRAPETEITPGSYTSAVDIWAAGAIFADLLCNNLRKTGKPLFERAPLQAKIHMAIFKVIGGPSEQDLNYVDNVNNRKLLAKKFGSIKRIPWVELYPNAGSEARDLLDRMLTHNPNNRISSEQALAHPYLSSSADSLANEENVQKLHCALNEVETLRGIDALCGRIAKDA